MARTFNCGIGMTIFVLQEDEQDVLSQLQAAGEEVSVIGELAPGADVTVGGEVILTQTEIAWQ
jgi:phosphoribosylaminoimidazole (AIR) synthetase